MKSQMACAITLTTSLLACAQPVSPSAAPTPGMRATQAQNHTTRVRVVVQFNNPAAIDAQAFVRHLQTVIRAPVRYVAAVSADTHVYLLEWQPRQDPAHLLQQLQLMSEVARAELDHKAKTP